MWFSVRLTRRVQLVPAVFGCHTANQSVVLLRLSAPSHHKCLVQRGDNKLQWVSFPVTHLNKLTDFIKDSQQRVECSERSYFFRTFTNTELQVHQEADEQKAVLPVWVPLEGSVLKSTPPLWQEKSLFSIFIVRLMFKHNATMCCSIITCSRACSLGGSQSLR